MSYFEDAAIGGKETFLQSFTPYITALKSTFFFASASIYLIHFKIVCPKFLKKGKIVSLVISIMLLILLFSATRYFLEEVLLFKISGIHNYFEGSRKFYFYIFDNSYFAFSAILYSTLIYLLIKFIDKKEHERAELDLLKSQISPHFLFNTLNAFYVDLIDDKPETARDIHKLSELLRYVTYESKKDYVFLDKEVQFLKDYIGIYNRRYENELAVNFKISGEINQTKIPSLILIHFIENLFKHGVVNDKENPAEINLKVTVNSIEISTKNKIIESVAHISSGIGTENIKRRLTTMYGNNYQLTHLNDGTFFNAYLKFPI